MTDITNIKDFQSSVVNQTKYFTDNILNFKSNPVKYNPFVSMNAFWQMQQFQKQFIKILVTPLDIQAAYWDMWNRVYEPKGKE